MTLPPLVPLTWDVQKVWLDGDNRNKDNVSGGFKVMLSILCWFGFLNFNIVYHGFLFYCTYSLCLLYFYFANKCFQSNMIAEETQPPRREACDDKTSRTGWVFLTIISSMTRTFRQQDEQDQLNDSWGIEITQTAWELRLFVCKNGLNRVSIHNDSHDKSAWGGTHHYSLSANWWAQDVQTSNPDPEPPSDSDPDSTCASSPLRTAVETEDTLFL